MEEISFSKTNSEILQERLIKGYVKSIELQTVINFIHKYIDEEDVDVNTIHSILEDYVDE